MEAIGHSLEATDQCNDHDLKEGMSVAYPHLCLSKRNNDNEFITVVECSQGFRKFSNIFTH